MNNICLIGRLTRDVELKTTNSGKNVAELSIAVNKRIKPKDGSPDADFFRVKLWGQSADYANNYLGKGRLVSISGRMESRKYTDKDGQNREVWEVVADNISGLDKPRDDAPTPSRNRSNAQDAMDVTDPGDYDPWGDE